MLEFWPIFFTNQKFWRNFCFAQRYINMFFSLFLYSTETSRPKSVTSFATVWAPRDGENIYYFGVRKEDVWA